MGATGNSLATLYSRCIGVIVIIGNFILHRSEAVVFFTRGCSFGYLAAVAMPLDLPNNKNCYLSFNFEANYGLPSNDSYNEWIDRWNLNEGLFGIGNNVTGIDGRQLAQPAHGEAGGADAEPATTASRPRPLAKYTRASFYRSFMGYLEYFGMNGTGCLLRTICEVAGDQEFDAHNGVLGSLFKILFMPTTSRSEASRAEAPSQGITPQMYEAEWLGRNGGGDCTAYKLACPQGVINMITLLL